MIIKKLIKKKKWQNLGKFTTCSMYPCTCVRVKGLGSGSIVHKIPRSVKDNLLECVVTFSRCRRTAGDRDVRKSTTRITVTGVAHDCKMEIHKSRTKNIYKAQRRILVNKRPWDSITTCIRLASDPSREPDEWEKPSLRFSRPLRRSERASRHIEYITYMFTSLNTLK